MARVPGDFDVAALFDAVEAQRVERGLSWSGLNRQIGWMGLGTLHRMRERADGGCHHVLPLIQWVGRTPESFTEGADTFPGELLPDPAPGRWRWYWDMPALAAAVEDRRNERGMTLADVAAELGTGPGMVKALSTTRYGTTIGMAMRTARWLGRTATSLMWEHDGRGLPWSGRRL